MDENDEIPVLSGAALEALKAFYADRDAREQQFEELKTKAERNGEERQILSMEAFAENWNESQFWYSQETATILAKQLLKGCTNKSTIAVVSAPSVFVQLKNILAANRLAEDKMPQLYLLEYDQRFSVFPEFVFYDFQKPLQLPPNLKGSVDHIICDPPFLSEDCQSKAALTVRWLSRSWGSNNIQTSLASKPDKMSSRLIVCTGERMQNLVNKLYRPQGIATTTFEPVHAKGLSNEFYCYANFECDNWKWQPI